MTNKITIYTDGACIGNPGNGGWAALLISNGEQKTLAGYAPYTTNNRMELMAFIAAIESLEDPSNIELNTDSQYVLKVINIVKKNRKGKFANRDMLDRLKLSINKHNIVGNWVKGHNGNVNNELVDKLANKAAYNQS